MDSRDLEFRWQSGGYNTHSGTLIYTDEDRIYALLVKWGYDVLPKYF